MQADASIEWCARREAVLYTTLEPCLLCMGAAMSFFLGRIVYALAAPADGAADARSLGTEAWPSDRRRVVFRFWRRRGSWRDRSPSVGCRLARNRSHWGRSRVCATYPRLKCGPDGVRGRPTVQARRREQDLRRRRRPQRKRDQDVRLPCRSRVAFPGGGPEIVATRAATRVCRRSTVTGSP